MALNCSIALRVSTRSSPSLSGLAVTRVGDGPSAADDTSSTATVEEAGVLWESNGKCSGVGEGAGAVIERRENDPANASRTVVVGMGSDDDGGLEASSKV